MIILPHQCYSAVISGISGATEWALKVAPQAASWVKARAIDVDKFGKAIAAKAKELWNSAITAAKDLWGFLKGWAKDDPLAAAAGGAALALGVLVLAPAIAGSAAAGGVISGIAGVAGALAGGLKGLLTIKGILFLGGLAIGAKAVVGFVLRGTAQVYNVDFNPTDAALAKQIQSEAKNTLINVGGQMGELVGQFFCGPTNKMGTPEVNVTLMAQVFDIVDKTTKENMLDTFSDILYEVKKLAIRTAFIVLFANSRRWVKQNIKTNIPQIDKLIAAWGSESKPWKIATTVEEHREKIKDETMQELAEEFIEGLIESCSEPMFRTA